MSSQVTKSQIFCQLRFTDTAYWLGAVCDQEPCAEHPISENLTETANGHNFQRFCLMFSPLAESQTKRGVQS